MMGAGQKGVLQLPALPTSGLILVNTVVSPGEILVVRKKGWQDSLLLAQSPGTWVCTLPPSLIRALGCAEKCPLSSVPPSPPTDWSFQQLRTMEFLKTGKRKLGKKL